MKFVSMSAAVLAAALMLSTAASADGPLPNPPPPSGPTASMIFDAMMAIARAAQSNPAAAQTATFSYNAAIQQYNIHDFDRARMSALTAISQAGAAPPPAPSIAPPPIPQPIYYQMPLLATANQPDAESFVALAHRAMLSCGAVGAAPPAAVQKEYKTATDALVAKNFGAARASSLNIVDDCAAATQAYVTTLQQGVR